MPVDCVEQRNIDFRTLSTTNMTLHRAQAQLLEFEELGICSADCVHLGLGAGRDKTMSHVDTTGCRKEIAPHCPGCDDVEIFEKVDCVTSMRCTFWK